MQLPLSYYEINMKILQWMTVRWLFFHYLFILFSYLFKSKIDISIFLVHYLISHPIQFYINIFQYFFSSISILPWNRFTFPVGWRRRVTFLDDPGIATPVTRANARGSCRLLRRSRHQMGFLWTSWAGFSRVSRRFRHRRHQRWVNRSTLT